MHHDSRISLTTPLPPLDMPSAKPRTRTHSKPTRSSRTSRSRSSSFDPDDLTTRLSAVLAEREAADRDRRRSAAPDCRARPPLPDPASAVVPSSVAVESLDLENGFSRARSKKARSFAAPTGLEYPWHRAPARVRGDESEDRDRSCPLLSEPIPSLATSAQNDSARRASNASGSRPSQEARYASQFASTTTAHPTLDDPRQTPRSVSAGFLNSPPASPPARRRSSLRASHGFWEGLHEPTIFEAIATDGKPADRRTMFEPTVRDYSDPLEPRRMSAGDALKAQLEGASAERRVSFEAPHYEVVNDHRVDWTQADEDTKMTRSRKLRRKADSILRLGRSPKTTHNGGDESSEGSLVDGQVGGYAVNGGSEKSPKSPKSPRFLRMWPFKKQIEA